MVLFLNEQNIQSVFQIFISVPLNCVKFHNFYHTMKIKSRILRLTGVGFRFCKKSDMSIKLNNLQNIPISIKSSINNGEVTIIL